MANDSRSSRFATHPSAAPTILALETWYRGYRFRSRLEARWAVFLTEAGIPFEYEPQGFEYEGVRYLPDFWLPTQRYWLEIKPTTPTEIERAKAEWLGAGTATQAFMLVGEPTPPDELNAISATVPAFDRHYLIYPAWDHYYAWCECPVCGFIGLEFEGRAARLDCGCVRRREPYADRCHATGTPTLLRAYAFARAERFDG